ncbi:MAG: DUF6434 domain-containing protein [Chloroflexota bacterium]
MSRPILTSSLSSQEFRDFYWLKAELIAFCRENRLPTSGSKADLTERIAHFLETGQILSTTRMRSKKSQMPNTFTRDTVIGDGWRCTQSLRAFFEQEIEMKFHFNDFMRDFVTNSGVGLTLQDAIDGWYQSKQQPKGEGEIGSQFEYNQHMRTFYKANPGASRQEAIEAWKEKRSKRASES